MKYYVNEKHEGEFLGTETEPFKTIGQAANIAEPGDEVLVYPGIYREYVDPKCGGRMDARITYKSIEPLKAVITGAEVISKWKKYKGNVYTARVSCDLFGDYNPFLTRVYGDWFIQTIVAHTGDVYLNGKSLYEVTTLKEVIKPKIKMESWDREFSTNVWYAEPDERTNEIVIYINIGGLDPNNELMEISVRENCFYPSKEGVGFITLSGFTINKAATQWAPPTAYQEGMVGPHWSKGWIIEDCDISESKCSGISLGKYKQENNDNKWSKWKYKDGTQTERDCICQAQTEGWTKENIGSHIIRRCNIHDCGQTGIVGHLGGVFSIIEDNHIHHINNKQNLAGAEIGGIKMHAAIDCIFRRNRIHDCTRGIWLDWQAQGTRVTGNIFYNNTLPNIRDLKNVPKEAMQGIGEDLFIEVSHGPTLLDNNIFLSERAVKIATQGVAMVHNLIAGSFVSIGIGTDNGAKKQVSPRYTPYHMPHRTEIAGFMTFLHGDDRFYNNIFIQKEVHPYLIMAEKMTKIHPNGWDDCATKVGTKGFDNYPTYAEWDKEFEGYCGMGSAPSDRYYMHLPVWSEGNVYFNGATPWKKEINPHIINDALINIDVVETEEDWGIETNLFDYLPKLTAKLINTETLGMAFEPEEKFENPDGSPITFNEDFYGNAREDKVTAGPFA